MPAATRWAPRPPPPGSSLRTLPELADSLEPLLKAVSANVAGYEVAAQ